MTSFGSMAYAICNSYYTPRKDVASSLSCVGVLSEGNTDTHHTWYRDGVSQTDQHVTTMDLPHHGCLCNSLSH